MIRKFAGHDRVSPPGTVVNTGETSPPGCINLEMPLSKAIEEYEKAQEGIQKALQAAYELGHKDGYTKGVVDAMCPFPTDPYSEAGR